MDTSIVSAFSYTLIYVFGIDDEKHKGLLKVGKATVKVGAEDDAKSIFRMNSKLLNEAANKRIRSYTQTAGCAYTLLYTEIAVRTVTRKGREILQAFTDDNIHKVLKNSGIKVVPLEKSREWFRTDLETVKKAIAAYKDGRNVLYGSEITEDRTPIMFRPEQEEAISKTVQKFKKGNKMLWNAKMRFGKTLSALEVARRIKAGKTIIITHRPVVDDGWYDDFKKIFYDTNYTYFNKGTSADALRECIRKGEPFVYFASIQDLRGSEIVGGKFVKNELVFETIWDLVIIDEAHEGIKTSLGDKVVKGIVKEELKKTKTICLSGTPFNLVDDFVEDEVYTWDYVMEQKAKAEWNVLHELDSNPYEGLPELRIYTYDIADAIPNYVDIEDNAFNFREFFRVWTGNIYNDGALMPSPEHKGRFVHEGDVKRFIELLRTKDESNYPFSKDSYRDFFRHSFWILPGVKEASALKELLENDEVFGQDFEIVNVAGEEENAKIKDPLKRVKDAISDFPDETRTITLSCGRLTTGVSVKPWTAVLMLYGNSITSASAYLQTIFRVQTPAEINGQIKDKCYVFDFAPDRTLKMVAEAGKISIKPGEGGDSEEVMKEFLNFCPVISIRGSIMKAYDVNSMLQQLKRFYASRVVRNGFDDTKLYNDKLLKLTDLDKSKFEELQKIVKATKAIDVKNDITINESGLGEEEQKAFEDAQRKKKTKKPLTPEEKEALAKHKEALEERAKAINILRAISIRIPLLVYGSQKDFDDDITIDQFTSLIDDASWEEFMPKGVTKMRFNEFKEYYDKDIFIEAGRQIRRKTKSADELAPKERVQKITEIFATFKNPDKETVLTPWRVVNLHMGLTLGGYDFFDGRSFPMDEPVYKDNGVVTQRTLSNINSKILEINAKSGLYPLYVTYSIFMERMKAIPEEKVTLEVQKAEWDKTVRENVFVVCKTKMAKSITQRTLMGYREGKINAHAFEDIANQFVSKNDTVCEKILSQKFWNKTTGEKEMKFDAVVGNPPYQEITAKNISTTNGQATRKSIFQFFQQAADVVTSGYTSLIYPGIRWIHRSGKGMEEFGLKQINDTTLESINLYINANEIFPQVAIADGISIVLKNKNKKVKGFEYIYHQADYVVEKHMTPPGKEMIIIDPRNQCIIDKVDKFVDENKLKFLNEQILPRSLFGVESNFVEENPSIVREYEDGDIIDYSSEVKLFTNDKAGKAGRAKWYVTDRANIPAGREYIDEWKVVVSSANAGGQKRDNQLAIVDNHSAFGRSRVALSSFKTKEEAENFYKYCKTYLIRFLFLMSDEALTSLGKKVVDIGDYSNKNKFLDFSRDLDSQMFKLVGLTEEEASLIKEKVDGLRNKEEKDMC